MLENNNIKFVWDYEKPEERLYLILKFITIYYCVYNNCIKYYNIDNILIDVILIHLNVVLVLNCQILLKLPNIYISSRYAIIINT